VNVKKNTHVMTTIPLIHINIYKANRKYHGNNRTYKKGLRTEYFMRHSYAFA